MTLDPVERTNMVLSAGAIGASLLLGSTGFTLSLAAGVALEAWNFRSLRRSAEFLFGGQITGGRGWLGVYSLRTSLLLGAIAAVLYLGANPIGLVIGLSTVIPAMLIEAWRARPPVDPSAPALADDNPTWERWNPWLAREEEEREDA